MVKNNDLQPDLQSTYRFNHSTEMAVLKVLANIHLALNLGDMARPYIRVLFIAISDAVWGLILLLPTCYS